MSNRNKDSQTPNRNDGHSNMLNSNPNGSSGYRESNDLTNPVGSVPFQVIGEGGSTRHAGSFYTNNPYLEQLRVAKGNEDKDALYERAVEWNADYYNLLEQRKYDKGVLDEQREYDSPIQQAIRAREAGINMDLGSAGNGGNGISSSNAQLAQREIKDQTAQTKFMNAYDNTQIVFEGINTAANLVSSIAGGYGTIMQGISTMMQLPSVIRSNNAQADLYGVQANEIDSMLSGKKKAQDLDNSERYMNQIGKLATAYLQPNFTDEEGTNLLTTMGIDPSEHARFMESVRGVHNNPKLLEEYNANQLAARQARIRNMMFDEGTVTKMVDLAKQSELMTLQFKYADNALMASVSSALLSDESYTENLIDTELQSALGNKTQATVQTQNMLKDAESWGRLWDEKMAMCKQAKYDLEQIKKLALTDGKWTAEELSNYNTAWINYMRVRDGLSTEFNQMRGAFIEVLQKRFERERMINGDGSLKNMDFIGALNYFSSMNFDNNFEMLPSGGEIVRNWIGTAGGFVKDIGIGVGAAAGGIKGFGPVTTTTTNVSGTYDRNTGQHGPYKYDRTTTVTSH